MSETIYSVIEKKGFRDGIGFIVTQDNCSIEVHLYSGLIIRAKAPRLSLDQICETLAHGDLKEISFRGSAESLALVQAPLLACIFPSVAASIVNPATTSPATLIKIVRLMSGLVKSDKDQGARAFEVMRQEIAKRHSGFLSDVVMIRKRMFELDQRFGLVSLALEHKAMPDALTAIPEWLFGRLDPIKDEIMKTTVCCFLFFGRMPGRMLRVKIEQATSLGAKQGRGILSKTVYPGLTDSGAASLFRDADKIGGLKIDWDKDEKETLIMTKADLDRLGLHKDDKINIILE